MRAERILLLFLVLGCREEPLMLDAATAAWPRLVAAASEVPEVALAAAPTSSAIGFARLCRGETHALVADRRITASEQARCQDAGIRLATRAAGTTRLRVVVPLANAWASSLTQDELKRIWAPGAEGRLTRWSHVRAGWPDRPLRLYAPGDLDAGFRALSGALLEGREGTRSDVTSLASAPLLLRGVARDPGALALIPEGWLDAAAGLRPLDAEGTLLAPYPLTLYARAGELDRADLGRLVQELAR